MDMVYDEPSDNIQRIVNHTMTVNRAKKVNTYIFCNNVLFCKELNYIYNIGIYIDETENLTDDVIALRSSIEKTFNTSIYDISGIFQKITLGTHGYGLFNEFKSEYVSTVSALVYNMYNFISVAALDGIITEYITVVCRDKYERYMLDDLLDNTLRDDCEHRIKIVMYDDFKNDIKNIKTSSDIHEIFVDDFDLLEEFCDCKNVELHIPSRLTSKELESKLKKYKDKNIIKSVVGLI